MWDGVLQMQLDLSIGSIGLVANDVLRTHMVQQLVIVHRDFYERISPERQSLNHNANINAPSAPAFHSSTVQLAQRSIILS